jgi:hypothetical protein
MHSAAKKRGSYRERKRHAGRRTCQFALTPVREQQRATAFAVALSELAAVLVKSLLDLLPLFSL